MVRTVYEVCRVRNGAWPVSSGAPNSYKQVEAPSRNHLWTFGDCTGVLTRKCSPAIGALNK